MQARPTHPFDTGNEYLFGRQNREITKRHNWVECVNVIVLSGGVKGEQDRLLTLLRPGLAGAGGVEEVEPAWRRSEPWEHYPEGDGEYGRASVGRRQGQIGGFTKCHWLPPHGKITGLRRQSGVPSPLPLLPPASRSSWHNMKFLFMV